MENMLYTVKEVADIHNNSKALSSNNNAISIANTAASTANAAKTAAETATSAANTATSAANAAKTAVENHVTNKNNPHGVTRDQLGAAAKSQKAVLTVAASAWTGEGPYIATVECPIATAGNNLEVGIGGKLTADQFAAIAAAMIVCTGQAAGSITLTAFGAMPEIDIPVNVLEVG